MSSFVREKYDRPRAGLPAPLVAGLLLVTALGCGSPTRGCDICTTTGVVYGRVTNAGGTPASGVKVSLEGRPGVCPGADQGVAQASAFTDATGRYRAELRSPLSPQTICVRASVPLANDGVVSGTGAVVTKETGNPPYDSVRVDLTAP
jgi:hypothetical protein